MVNRLPSGSPFGIGCNRIAGVLVRVVHGSGAARDLDPDPVAGPECMGDMTQIDAVFLDLPGREQLSRFQAVPIAGSDDAYYSGSEHHRSAVRVHVEDGGGEIRVARVARGVELDADRADDFDR